MRLHSIALRNIRSYLSETITFPEGSVLLAGDIGSGKSTVLLAIEFALFGIKKGELSGEALLRNGKREGNVELCLTVKEKKLIIKRTLKRTKDGVKQEAGYLLLGDLKREGTPVELRAWILELLGYPEMLLEKGKDLIYRYTVYTPQEEMKRILSESSETRLDILRRVFQIDKYKRIRENAQVMVGHLREQVRMHEGRALTLEANIAEQVRGERKLVETAAKIAHKKADREQIANLLAKAEERQTALQGQLADLREKRLRFDRAVTELQGIARQRTQIQQDVAQLEKLIIPVVVQEDPGLKGSIAAQRDALRTLQERERQNRMRQGEAMARQRQCQSTISSLERLDNCPTCLQHVPSSHKEQVIGREQAALQQLLQQKAGLAQEQEQLTSGQRDAQAALDLLQRKTQEQDILLLKARQNENYLAQIAAKKKLLEELKARAGAMNGVQQELSAALLSAKDVEQQETDLAKELKLLRQQERELMGLLSGLQSEEMALKEQQTRFAEEIRLQKESKKLAQESQALAGWLSEPFTSLMSVIEQHVMARIQQEFNALFSEWFSLLMEDEGLSVRIDDRFTPIVTQNGFETEISYLSGGEQTSAALAYRLALNKVINDLIGHIETKDLIILDEPTDGFSAEQLDRLKDVFERLNLGQVIVVSHESKIESFVDHVIRVQKEEHASRIT
ncbi:MAG: SMC family ATPase [Nanoarchaeota archaeon]